MLGSMVARRRCEACPNTLPLDANPRQRYCSPACVARAYRARHRFGDIYQRILHDSQHSLYGDDPDTDVGVACPGCGWRIYPGGRRLRADARHCSTRCRNETGAPGGVQQPTMTMTLKRDIGSPLVMVIDWR